MLGKQLACAYVEYGSEKRAIETLLRLLERDPFDEETYELLLETYTHMKERSSFLSWYEKYQAMLEEELGLKVKPRMRQLRIDVLESE